LNLPPTGPSSQVTQQFGTRPASSTTGSVSAQTDSQSSTYTPGSKPSAAKKTAKKKDSTPTTYTGRMNLPSTSDTVNSTGSSSTPPAQPAQTNYPQLVPQNYQQPTPQQRNSQPPPQANLNTQPSSSTTGLRLSSQPMNPTAARAQAMLTDETDGQITQGLVSGPIRYLPNAVTPGQPALPAAVYPAGPSSSANNSVTNPVTLTYNNAQYTPSAQDAAAGAYSAQKQAATPQPQSQIPAPPPPAQTATPAPQLSTKSTHKHRKTKPANANSVPTLVTAPGEAPALPRSCRSPTPPQGTQSTSTTGLSDQELQERNLPPLRGPWAASPTLSPQSSAHATKPKCSSAPSKAATAPGSAAPESSPPHRRPRLRQPQLARSRL
jgi:hypothetical protein